ncbi:hypothetical protein E2C01_021432 [Portunus trituberculatus]|uniref:Uncharacterized protein n=1 Tax=Portunus trituberculatus TaxID=210409 RepID=A0A5B7E623_PORTR|nr:hypothetical protein [Portunus trituberculatus]
MQPPINFSVAFRYRDAFLCESPQRLKKGSHCEIRQLDEAPSLPKCYRESNATFSSEVTSGAPQGLTMRYHRDRTGILIKINNW